MSQGIGVNKAPPRLSSDPKLACTPEVAFPHDTAKGSAFPFERTVALEGSGIAGGSGNVLALEETCTTLSTACK